MLIVFEQAAELKSIARNNFEKKLELTEKAQNKIL